MSLKIQIVEVVEPFVVAVDDLFRDYAGDCRIVRIIDHDGRYAVWEDTTTGRRGRISYTTLEHRFERVGKRKGA